jgi:hypothetical protein
VFAAIGSLIFYGGRSCVALANYADLDNKSRNALDRMSQEIRQANEVTGYSTAQLSTGQVITNQLVLSGTGTGGAAYTLTYNYDLAKQTLSRMKVEFGATNTIVLLTGCYYFNFGMFQRNPVDGTYDQYPVADPSTCKVVQLFWICSRNIFGETANTESIISAKVVIRKE